MGVKTLKGKNSHPVEGKRNVIEITWDFDKGNLLPAAEVTF